MVGLRRWDHEIQVCCRSRNFGFILCFNDMLDKYLGYVEIYALWVFLFYVMIVCTKSTCDLYITYIYIGEEKYMDAYNYFASTKDSIDMLFFKLLFIGPPGLGKTTVLRRLMGEITDLESAGEAGTSKPSTVAVEIGNSVVVRSISNTSAVVTEFEWCATKTLEDEVEMLFHSLIDSIHRKTTTSQDESSEKITEDPVKTVGESTSRQPTSHSHPLEDVPSEKDIGTSPQDSTFSVTNLEDIPGLADIKKIMSSPHWKDVKRMFKAHLRMEDTGGQPELMDMLPALTIGPGLYLLFVNLQNELHNKYRVSYRDKSGLTSIPEMSSHTVEELILSTLSSISCSSTMPNSMHSQESSIQDINNILRTSKSVTYIIGTHKDMVSDEHIAKFDSDLKRIIRSTDFFKSTVRFCSENKLVMPMNNMNGGRKEIIDVKKLLEHCMDRDFNKLKIPAVWLLFSLCLRKTGNRIASLESCLLLSSHFNMSDYETKVALWFLHHHAGVIMYFPGVPELEDLVIIDIQVVYDSVTILILRSISFENVDQAPVEKFRKTGQFSLQDLIKATAKYSGDLIPPLKLVALLEYLHIIAKLDSTKSSTSQSSEQEVYIMPCVLEHASKDQLELFCQDATNPLSAPPIMVYFTCGFVPIGIFPAMIACLVANEKFHLIKKDIKKNFVQFRYGHLKSRVRFISQPQYYEVDISILPEFRKSIHSECTSLRKEIELTLDKASSRMNYGGYKDYQFSFECPLHTNGNHLCVINRKELSPKVMTCLLDRDNPECVVLRNGHLIWFDQVKV